jgi:B12-binding domain/radical SAM domain protein
MRSSFQEVALLCYYTKENRYSFNALVGALETCKDLDAVGIYFANEPHALAVILEDLLTKHEKIVVAVSFMTYQTPQIHRMVDFIRSNTPENRIILVAGGPHPTGDPAGTLDMGFDVVTRGEGEETLPALIRCVASDGNMESVRGIAYDTDGTRKITAVGRKPDIDHYPPFATRHKKFGPIEISRGCPWTCRFCQTPFLFGTKVRHRSVSNICKFVKVMMGEDLNDMRFISPNAFMYGSEDGKTVELGSLEELLRSVRGVLGGKGRVFFGTFPSEVRPESVTTETIELVKKYCDNDNLVIGAQSGSERILEYICRGHGVQEVYRAVELTLKSGLKANVDIIFGLPNETAEDARLTLTMARRLARMGARIHAHTFMPLPGTPFGRMPPGRMRPMMKKEAERLVAIGKLYGQWKTQESIANRQQM